MPGTSTRMTGSMPTNEPWLETVWQRHLQPRWRAFTDRLPPALGGPRRRGRGRSHQQQPPTNGDSLEEEEKRIVFSNDSQANEDVPNRIANTKYTPLTFLPLNLFEQFRRFMNFYFLLIAMLQLSPTLTPVSPITTWVPLGVIFFISALKEGLDDYRRYRTDTEANTRLYTIIRDHQKLQVRSEEINLGDIVFVQENSEFPCDLALLSSSEAMGSCYVQTANIDGETDLKPRIALPETAAFDQDSELIRFMAELHCSPPDNHLYRFDAAIRLKSLPQSTTGATHSSSSGGAILASTSSSRGDAAITATKDFLSLSSKQLLLQGTFLRNTDFIYGLAVYTGRESKLGMNKQKPKTKWTRLDRKIDIASRFIFLFQLSLVLILGITGNQMKNSLSAYWYLDMESDGKTAGALTPLVIPIRMLLLMSFMIPISLKVSLDIAKYVEAAFIDWDLKMYDAATDEPAHASSTAIAEDLGQIEYIFTDKTGTLTENIMVFKRCTIGGNIYGTNDPSYLATLDPVLVNTIRSQSIPQAVDFFRCLALCSTVIPVKRKESTSARPSYRGSSPDEEALVAAAAELGIIFYTRSTEVLEISVLGQPEMYKILQVFEFSSDRKRMSVLLRKLEKKQGQRERLFLFTKGADDVIFAACGQQDQPILQATARHLEGFAEAGYRTLCVAYREISEAEYKTWTDKFYLANTSLVDREQKLAECFALLETDLRLLGATAIEDRLQEQVPETIKLLRTAGLRIWMLTGDKKATALQISTSCNLIESSAAVTDTSMHIDINADEKTLPSELTEMLERHLLAAQSLVDPTPSAEGTPRVTRKQISVILDGAALRRIMEDSTCTKLFVELGLLSHAVICCRVTPHQKAAIVELVAKRGYTTLAIGDGGNDVAMIQKANIGVGIKGREGLQASRASDYSVGKFKFLGRLILVHGRYAYKRSSFIALYCFYKSIYLALTQALYEFYCAFSGTSLLNTFSLSTYNILFTGLPILFHVLDKDIREDMIFRFPSVFQETVRGSSFNKVRFLGWASRAFLQSLITFFFGIAIFSSDWATESGMEMGHGNLALFVFSIAISVQTGTLFFESNSLTLYNFVIIFGTLAFYYATTAVISTVPEMDMYGMAGELLQDATFWYGLVVATTMVLLPFVAFKYYLFNDRPRFFECIQKVQHDGSGSYAGDMEMSLPKTTSTTRATTATDSHIERGDAYAAGGLSDADSDTPIMESNPNIPRTSRNE